MTWNNVPNRHITIFLFYFYIMESQITFLSWHAMTNLHDVKKI
jgi:hypothetical protein